MGHQFAQHHEAEVPASPDEVWAAIATGPGIDSWFMGRNEVAAGTVRTVFGEYTPELEITEADPAHRFAYRSGRAPDGRFIAYEFLIEGRGGVTIAAAGTVSNAGTIAATGSGSRYFGVDIQGAGTVSNLGTASLIEGWSGVVLSAGGAE